MLRAIPRLESEMRGARLGRNAMSEPRYDPREWDRASSSYPTWTKVVAFVACAAAALLWFDVMRDHDVQNDSLHESTSTHAPVVEPTAPITHAEPPIMPNGEYYYPKSADGCPDPSYVFPGVDTSQSPAERVRRCRTNANAFCFQGQQAVEDAKSGCEAAWGVNGVGVQ